MAEACTINIMTSNYRASRISVSQCSGSKWNW